MELSENNFEVLQMEFGKNIIRKCLRIFSMRIFSMRCDWNLAKTLFENVLEYLRLLQKEGRIGKIRREVKGTSKLGVKEFRLE